MSSSLSFSSLEGDARATSQAGGCRAAACRHWKWLSAALALVLLSGALGAAIALAAVGGAAPSNNVNPRPAGGGGGTAPAPAPSPAPPAPGPAPPPICAERRQPSFKHPNIRPYLTTVQFQAGHSPSRPIVLNDCTVIDPNPPSGGGAARRAHQAIVIEGTRITHIVDADKLGSVVTGDFASLPCENNMTVVPGFIGMHEHMFHTSAKKSPFLPNDPPVPENVEAIDGTTFPMNGGGYLNSMFYSAPKLYLAAGVTTARTAGAVDAWADLNLANDIQAGKDVGPRILPTAPYIAAGTFLQMQRIRGPSEAAKSVREWRSKGFHNFKLYMNLTKEEAKAAVDAASALGCKTTAHISRMTAKEAVFEAGLKNLEHGLGTWKGFDKVLKDPKHLDGEFAQKLLQGLLDQGVTLTSTLGVLADLILPRYASVLGFSRRERAAQPAAWAHYLDFKNQGWANLTAHDPKDAEILANSTNIIMPLLAEFDKRFLKMGGRLMFGCDPTGTGAFLPGFGDHQSLKLLVEPVSGEGDAGPFDLSVSEILRVSSSNAAEYLEEEACIGGVREGMFADLVLLPGDLMLDPTAGGTTSFSAALDALWERGYVVKDGLVFDPRKLLAAVKHQGGAV